MHCIMMNKISSLSTILAAATLLISSCKKTEYNFGALKSPSNLVLNTVVVGTSTSAPDGNGSGIVQLTVTADNAITYNIDFGDGNKQMVPSGVINYKYTSPGTFDYTITVNAVGTGGILSTVSKRIRVFVAFTIPDAILSALTNGSSKVWVSDKDAPGHFGVGPAAEFTPIWYSADPNSRQPCAYDDEITFSKDAAGNVFMLLDNRGQSFVIGAAAAYYGLANAEDCRDINTAGTKRLSFMDATSASTPAVSTRIQFTVPGNGLVNWGVGSNTYEILSITSTQMHLRTIGVDGNAWYTKLKVKP
jgi:hypothetical protein